MVVFVAACSSPPTADVRAADRPSADGAASARGPHTEQAEASPDQVVDATMPSDLIPPPEGDRVNLGGVLGAERLDADGLRKVFVRRAAQGPLTELVVAEWDGAAWTESVRIAGPPAPDRPAISPDGETIAFVSGVTGVASVWVTPFEGGVDPTQLTNVGLHLVKRDPAHPPAGFVPPPIDGSLTFDGDELSWTTPDGVVRVAWR